MDRKRLSRNEPCPCGSGKKYKHCCLLKMKRVASRPSPTITDLYGMPKKCPKYPIGTMAFYGPDDMTTTKIAAGVFTSPTAKSIIQRWVATDVTTNPKIQREIQDFFKEHGVKSVAMKRGKHGLPARGGQGFPRGRGLPVLPVLGGEAGEQPEGLTTPGFNSEFGRVRRQTSLSRRHE